jgi:hypothetical protein
MKAVTDLLLWIQGGLQGLGGAVSLRVREEPVLTVGLFRAGGHDARRLRPRLDG